MGLDDIAISFALSYLARNIPTIKDKLSKTKDLKGCIASLLPSTW